MAVLIAAVAAWWLWPEGATRQDAASTKKTLIKEAKPTSVSTNRPKSKAELQAEKLKNFCTTNKVGRVVRFERVTVDENGKKWFMGQPVPEVQPGDVFLHGKKLGTPEYFKNPSENFLAQQILGEVGLPSSAPRELPSGLIRNMKEHLRDPIEISPDDSPEAVQMKKDMIELKAEIAARIDAGEDLETLLDGVRKEIDYFANMREGYLDGLKQLEKSGATDEELADYVNAANKILGENNATKIKMPMSIQRKMLKAKLKAIREGRN